MEIQWVILALKFIMNERTGMLSILDIAHKYNLDGRGTPCPLCVIAKYHMRPQEAFGTKNLILSIIHDDEEKTSSISFQLPDFKVWAEKVPYFYILLDDLGFTTEGEYTVRLSVDGQECEETIKVIHGGANGIK